jgi:hypothetical protein
VPTRPRVQRPPTQAEQEVGNFFRNILGG